MKNFSCKNQGREPGRPKKNAKKKSPPVFHIRGMGFSCFSAARTPTGQASNCAPLPICREHKSCHLGLAKSCDQITGSNNSCNWEVLEDSIPKMPLFGPVMICCHVVHQHPPIGLYHKTNLHIYIIMIYIYT